MNDLLQKRRATVIIANGNFPTHPIPLSVLKNAEYIVCCDGAANDFIAQGGIPDAIVGDCDSISAENRIRFADILHPNLDQETNDLTKAVNFCVNQQKKELIILGATGKREDHTLGNISLLAEYMDFAEVMLITDYGVFTPIAQTAEFKSYSEQQVSIFSIDAQPLSSFGLKYPLKNQILRNWWEGTLNEATDSMFRIETAGKVIVFQVFMVSEY